MIGYAENEWSSFFAVGATVEVAEELTGACLTNKERGYRKVVKLKAGLRGTVIAITRTETGFGTTIDSFLVEYGGIEGNVKHFGNSVVYHRPLDGHTWWEQFRS